MQNAPAAPGPGAGLAGLSELLGKAGIFKDITGLDANQQNALKTLLSNNENAKAFGEMAKEMAMQQHNTANSDKITEQIDAAKAKKTIDNAKASQLTTDHLQQMIDGGATKKAELETAKDAASPSLTKAAVDAAAQGKDVKATQVDVTGKSESVDIQGGPKQDTPAAIISVAASAQARTFGPRTNLTGQTTLSVRATHLPAGAKLEWRIPAGEAGKYTITQRMTSLDQAEVEIAGIIPGLTSIIVSAEAAGAGLASVRYPLSIPQFVEIDDRHANFDKFLTDNALTGIRDGILDEARRVLERLVESEANVRLVWASRGDTVPAHVTAQYTTTVQLANTDPSGKARWGITVGGPGRLPKDVGDIFFNEAITLWPASYLIPGDGEDVNARTTELLEILQSIQASTPALERWRMLFFGRMIGETMSHEIYHALLPVPFFHNVDGANPPNDVDTGDLMDTGTFRTLLRRTGIDAQGTSVADFLARLTDRGIAAINTLTAIHLTDIHSHFPVPPAAPFNT